MPRPPKALILDRDGTLIEHVPYLADPAGVALLTGIRDALKIALDHGALLFLHTNQSGIGRGMFDEAQAHACNEQLVRLLDLGPHPFARICIAPEAPDEPSRYRKPSPEFAHEIMSSHGLEPDELCYVGDRGSDLATAAAAGTRGVGVATGLDDLKMELRSLGLEGRYPVFDSLQAAMLYLFAES